MIVKKQQYFSSEVKLPLMGTHIGVTAFGGGFAGMSMNTFGSPNMSTEFGDVDMLDLTLKEEFGLGLEEACLKANGELVGSNLESQTSRESNSPKSTGGSKRKSKKSSKADPPTPGPTPFMNNPLKHLDPRYQHLAYTKYIMRNYAYCKHQLLRHLKTPKQVCVATENECFYVWSMPEFELYLTVPRGISTSVIGQFYQWLKSQRDYLFLNAGTW